jgi:hypothetical protein
MASLLGQRSMLKYTPIKRLTYGKDHCRLDDAKLSQSLRIRPDRVRGETFGLK